MFGSLLGSAITNHCPYDGSPLAAMQVCRTTSSGLLYIGDASCEALRRAPVKRSRRSLLGLAAWSAW